MVRACDGHLHDIEGNGIRLAYFVMESLILVVAMIGLWLLLQLVILPHFGFDT